MSKKSRILILLISLIFCLSAFSITAFAVEDVADDPAQNVTSAVPEEPATEYTEQEPADNTVVTPDDGTGVEPDYSGDYDYTEPVTEDNQWIDNSGNNGDDGTGGNIDDGSYSGDDSGSVDDYSYDDYSYDDYVPDFESNDYVIQETQTVIDSDLYDVKDKIDDRELSDSDWNAIAKSLENASDIGTGDDFSFIKNNTSSSDNGLWILITGSVLIIIAIVGITYVIISTMSRRKAYANPAGGTGSAGGSRSADSSKQRARNDYNDGYGGTPRLAKKRRTDDTADIKLPRNSGGNHYRK